MLGIRPPAAVERYRETSAERFRSQLAQTCVGSSGRGELRDYLRDGFAPKDEVAFENVHTGTCEFGVYDVGRASSKRRIAQYINLEGIQVSLVSGLLLLVSKLLVPFPDRWNFTDR